MKLRSTIFALLIAILPCSFVSSQSIATTFGKNRVQYHDDFNKWDVYETPNFVTYWYGKGRFIAQSVVQMAELDHDEIQGVMEHRFNDKIEIIVYTDLTDLKQSNHGIEETFVSTTGETKIVGNKMFVYFDGNHLNLRRKIREGIASVYINSILFGSNIQEIVQNAVLLDVPQWYKDGLVAYVGQSWDYEYDDELRDLLENKPKYYDFYKLASDFPEIAGHSMWHFIEQNYGRSSISNILYLTRINRNLESSFLYVLSTDYETVLLEWSNHYKEIFAAEEGQFEQNLASIIDLKNKAHQPISAMELSPNGEYLLYAINDIGKLRIVLRDLKTGKDKTLHKQGYRNPFQETDFNYPLLAWHPRSNELSYIYEKKDVVYLEKYYPSTDEYEKTQVIPQQLERIYSLSYIDAENYVMSATTKGYSDLILYKYKTRQFENITEDFYDDLDARFIKIADRKGILFTSNRTDNLLLPEELDTILPIENFDVFFYDLDDRTKSLERLTFTPNISESRPILIGNKLAFIRNATGIANRYIKELDDDSNGYANSNKSRNIILHTASPTSDQYLYMDYRNGAYQIYEEYPDLGSTIATFPTQFYQNSIGTDVENVGLNLLLLKDQTPIKEYPEMKDGYLFQSPYGDPDQIEDIYPDRNISFDPDSKNQVIEVDALDILKFNPAKIVASRKKFRLDNFTTRMDNEVLFEGLESFVGEDPSLTNQPLGILLKANVLDIFEDYSFEGGVRIPTTFDGSEYFLVFEDRKKLIDKKYALYRKSNIEFRDDISNRRTKRTSLLGLAQYRYPFNIYKSLRLTTSLRFDRLYENAVNTTTLEQPFENEKRVSLRAEYVFDNTIDVDLNIKNGTRYKIYSEAINRFDLNVVDGFDFSLSDGFTTIIGFDARHYIPIWKNAVLALRAAGSTSFGSEKMLYYLGGTENWLFSQFDETIPIPQDESFSYKALAPALRGFNVNVRNGGSYALANAELRMPIFKLLSKRRVKSSILRNFQLIGFYDVGTAWVGFSPWSDDNPLNTLTLESPPIITVNVEYFRDPIIMGYGAGMRTALFGYYIRLDWAYGLETKQVTDPKLYFSIGTDF